MTESKSDLFGDIAARRVTTSIVAGEEGVLSGTAMAAEEAQKAGLTVERIMQEGSAIKAGDEIARISATAEEIVPAAEIIIGLLAKPSGIATAARACAKAVGKKLKVACTAWSKLPLCLHETAKAAIASGGALPGIASEPFVYLDCDTTAMLGGISESIDAASRLEGEKQIVVQLMGRHGSIIKEALQAAEKGAGTLFIATGVQLDVMEVSFELERAGLRKKTKVAFGGGVTLKDLRKLKGQDVDVIDMGREIADAPFLDMKMEVVDLGED